MWLRTLFFWDVTPRQWLTDFPRFEGTELEGTSFDLCFEWFRSPRRVEGATAEYAREDGGQHGGDEEVIGDSDISAAMVRGAGGKGGCE